MSSLVVRVFRLNGAILAVGDELVEDLGLTSARWQVLGAISQGDASVSQIARRMGLSRQGVQQIANRLHADDLVETRDNPDHARAKLYTLSQKGAQVIDRVNQRQSCWANETADKLGLRRLKQAEKLLAEAIVLLENQDASEFIR